IVRPELRTIPQPEYAIQQSATEKAARGRAALQSLREIELDAVSCRAKRFGVRGVPAPLSQRHKNRDSGASAKLLRAYLAIGAKICGPPAIDREFGTIDFLTLL